MFQISTSVKTFQVEYADTATHAFALTGDTGGLVNIQAHPSNTGTVTLLGITNGTAASVGPVLEAGDWHPPLMLNALSGVMAYKFSTSGDKLNITMAR